MKSVNKVAATAIFLIAIAPVVHGKEVQAPLGLQWGMTQAEAESKGMRFSECKNYDWHTVCRTKNPPKPVSFGDFYDLTFASNHGLVKVTIFGENITSDSTGSEGKELYASLKISLVKKYGKPSIEAERVGVKLYNEWDEFYQCLAYDGCGLWAAIWKPTDGGGVALQIKGISRGKGFVVIDYESVQWNGLVDANKQQKTAQDDDAL